MWAIVEKLNPVAHLTLVGPEDTERCQKLSEKLRLNNLSIHTRTESVSPFFDEAKLFISTSIFEGFPNVVLEAISYGIPVVTTPSCDLVEDFEQKGAAIVVESANPAIFAQAIVDLLNDSPRLSRMSQDASILARKYSWENVRADWYLAINAAIKHYKGAHT